MSIDALIKQAATQPKLIIPPGWGQGRATFGGLIASLLYSHLQANLGENPISQTSQGGFGRRVLRSATISFIGAVAQGEVAFESEVFRSGKSVTQASVRLIQNGAVQAILLASFGGARASSVEVAPLHRAPELKQPEQVADLPYIAGIMPEFFQQTNLRWAEGDAPFSGSKKADFAGWMRWRDSIARVDVAHVIGLVDAWPPSVFPLFKAPAFASTLCWTIEFIEHHFDQSSDNWWQYRVITDYAHDGYAHAEAHIWDDQGRLVAISRQVSTIFI